MWGPENGHSRMSRRSGSVQHDSQPITPVWTPRSAHSSPVAARKQFRPVQFQSPVPGRKFTNVTTGDDGTTTSGPGATPPPPPWEQPGFDKLPPPPPVPSPHHHNHHHQHHSAAAAADKTSMSSVRRLAHSFSAPKLNNGTVVEWPPVGHRSEPYSKHSRNYVCPPTRSLFEGNE